MQSSPRNRRLNSDLKALKKLVAESSIIDFTSYGSLPESYTVIYRGKGFWRAEDTRRVLVRDRHEVNIRLGASYPRQMPELNWLSPIFHPNISGCGSVCLGGYGTHWVPSLSLSELCEMLWEMIRYANFDIESPYNREAAHWARTQREYLLPIDSRPLRDRVTGYYVGDMFEEAPVAAEIVEPTPEEDVIFLDGADIVDGANIVDGADIFSAPAASEPQEDILFLE